jgi:hypothetical protein
MKMSLSEFLKERRFQVAVRSDGEPMRSKLLGSPFAKPIQTGSERPFTRNQASTRPGFSRGSHGR